MLPEVQLNRSQVRLNRKEGAVALSASCGGLRNVSKA